jgi:sodium/hydrogen exchanger-like protein 6/7
LVFGESILNDAVSMVFYDTVSEFEGEEGTLFLTLFIPLLQFFFILIGSSLIGMLTGFLGSLIVKKATYGLKNPEKIEVTILVTLPWFSYLFFHINGLSAIVVIFFQGISFSLYSKPFIRQSSEHIIHQIYDNIGNVAESIVFIFIGIAFMADHPFT